MLKQHVFLSYRHESPEHIRAVRRLGEMLRSINVPVVLDQFLLDENPGGPSLGWPAWCEEQVTQSACVLIVASSGWFSSYDDPAGTPGGYGAAGEAQLFRQALWDEKGFNDRLRIAFLHELAPDTVPLRLRAWQQFRPFDDDEKFKELARWVSFALGIKVGELTPVRWPKPVDFEPDLADRVDTEWRVVRDLMLGNSPERILFLQGDSGMGKSELLWQTATYADRLGIPVARINLKGGGLDVAAILGQFHLELSKKLPNFSRDGGSKTYLLRMDLRALREPALAIFDHFEDVAANKPIVDWLNQQFLPEVETAPGLAVIVAGQKVPEHAAMPWRDTARRLELGPIIDLVPWEKWVARKFPTLKTKQVDLNTILLVAKGNPSMFAYCCQAIAGT